MDRKQWDLLPNTGIGGLDFGGDRATIMMALGEPIRTIRKGGSSDAITDAYSSFHVHYSVKGKMEAIEFFGRDVCLTIKSVPVYPGTLDAAKKILPDLEEKLGSYVSKASSVGIYVEEGNITSVLVGCKDYYKQV